MASDMRNVCPTDICAYRVRLTVVGHSSNDTVDQEIAKPLYCQHESALQLRT